MKNQLSISRDTVLRGLDAVFSIMVIPLATYSDYQNEQRFLLLNIALFAALSLAKVFQILSARDRSASCSGLVIKTCAYLASALLLLVIPSQDTARRVIGIMMTAVLILECLQFVWRHRTFSAILCSAACILTLCLVIKGDYYRVLVYLLVQVFTHIVILSFSQMNLKILVRIIRKIHAASIMAGLLLLMTAASFMIPPFEDAVWYCFSIVTNIGFARYAAASDVGKLISVILGIYGMVVVALITSIIVNFYLEVKTEPDDGEDDLPV